MMTLLVLIGLVMFITILSLILAARDCELEDEARKEIIEKMQKIAERHK